MNTRLTLLVLMTALLTVLNLIAFLSLSESYIVEDDSNSNQMMQGTEIIDAIYYYPELTYVEEHLLMWEKYKLIDIYIRK